MATDARDVQLRDLDMAGFDLWGLTQLGINTPVGIPLGTSVGLQIGGTTKALLLSSLTAAQEAALTAGAGMVLYQSDAATLDLYRPSTATLQAGWFGSATLSSRSGANGATGSNGEDQTILLGAGGTGSVLGGNGANLLLQSGTGGSPTIAAAVGGTGGTTTLKGGAGIAANVAGTIPGPGGPLVCSGGSGGLVGVLNTGNGANGGAATFTAGAGGAGRGAGNSGGAGNTGTFSAGTGGGGAGGANGGIGGVGNFSGGDGGNVSSGSTSDGGAGQIATFRGGNGGSAASATAGNGGAGANVSLVGGRGGSAKGAGKVGGAGADVLIDVGAGGNASGGATAGSAGTDILIGTVTGTPKVTIGTGTNQIWAKGFTAVGFTAPTDTTKTFLVTRVSTETAAGNVTAAWHEMDAVAGAASSATFNASYNIATTNTASNYNTLNAVTGGVIHQGAGTLSNAFGVFFAITTNAGGTITNAYNFYCPSPNVSGVGSAIGTIYGLRVDKQKVGGVSNGYGVYQADTGDLNVFAGRMTVGAAADPGAGLALDVQGNASVTGKLTVTGAIDPTSIRLSSGTALYYESANGNTAAVSAANEGRIRYNSTGQQWEMSMNGAAYVAIGTGGGTVTGTGAANRIATWSGASSLTSNANFTYDGTTFTLVGAMVQNTGAVGLTANAASSFTTSAGALTLTGGAASTWSTSAGALSIDAAAALNLGGTNATSVAIGRSGTYATVLDKLSVGLTTAPVAVLDVGDRGSAALSGTNIGAFNTLTTTIANNVAGVVGIVEANPSGATTKTYRAGYYSALVTSGNAQTVSSANLIGLEADANYLGTQTVGTCRALYGLGQSTGNVTNLTGVRGEAIFNGTGTATNVRASQVVCTNASSGTIGTCLGNNASLSNTGTGTITTAVCFRANSISNSGGGTITNAVGVDINDQTVATNNTLLLMGDTGVPVAGNWGIYSASSYASAFAGSMSVGLTTAPVAVLDVGDRGSAALAGTNILAANTKTTATTATCAEVAICEANPSALTTATYRGQYVNAFVTTGNAQDVSGATVTGADVNVTYGGTQTIGTLRGAIFVATCSGANVTFLRGVNPTAVFSGSGTATNVAANLGVVNNTGTGTITHAQGFRVNSMANSGGGTITNAVGIMVLDQTAGTNNINLLLGTGTEPTGNWSIYGASGKNSSLLGAVTIGANTAPTTSAILDLSSTTGALLVPRMTTTQKNALTPTNGMIVYDSTLNKFQGYENGAWTSFI